MAWEKENSLNKRNRNRLEIIRDILLVADNAGGSGSRRTHIMYGANLSYKLLTRYLRDVSDAGFICEGGSCYFITDKGREFIQLYETYEKESREVEKHNAKLSNSRAELRKMLALMGQ